MDGIAVCYTMFSIVDCSCDRDSKGNERKYEELRRRWKTWLLDILVYYLHWSTLHSCCMVRPVLRTCAVCHNAPAVTLASDNRNECISKWQLNSALHPSGVAKSSTSFGWGKDGKVTSATDSLGDIWKIIYLGFEKSQRSVTHDFLRYINILTYLLTY